MEQIRANIEIQIGVIKSNIIDNRLFRFKEWCRSMGVNFKMKRRVRLNVRILRWEVIDLYVMEGEKEIVENCIEEFKKAIN